MGRKKQQVDMCDICAAAVDRDNERDSSTLVVKNISMSACVCMCVHEQQQQQQE